ncbi:MAG: F0F1 ATP synthase subunit B family protein [Ilumatobacteraceae bacterium]
MITRVVALLASEDPTVTHHWLLPETAEIIYGGLSSFIVFGLLYKFAGPAAKKAMAARTERIQKELDGAAQARSKSESDASDIRMALGDVDAERFQLFAEADAQAAALIVDGRNRIASEVTDLEIKAAADLVAARGRGADELRAEIALLASLATPAVVQATLTDQTKQELIEAFISSVGASR